MIRAAWEQGGPITRTSHFRPKLDGCQRSLEIWSKKEFKHNVGEMNKVKARLRVLNSIHRSPSVDDEERALKSRLHALWKREEIY